MRSFLAVVSFPALLALAACGDQPAVPGGPGGGGSPAAPAPAAAPAAAPATKAEATKARLLAFFEVVKAGGGAAAAPFVVYRGEDRVRAWKDLANYAVEGEQKHVDLMVARVARLLALGAPTFGEFKSEKESEGTWLVWEVTFGAGEKAKKSHLACLEVKGTPALGDLD